MRCDMAAQMEVLEEINATRDRQCAAQAAGHAATARFLEHRAAALKVRLNEIMGVEPAVHRQPSSPRLYPYTPTETGLSAAVQRLADIVLMRKRRDAAHAATDAEILRLEKQAAERCDWRLGIRIRDRMDTAAGSKPAGLAPLFSPHASFKFDPDGP